MLFDLHTVFVCMQIFYSKQGCDPLVFCSALMVFCSLKDSMFGRKHLQKRCVRFEDEENLNMPLTAFHLKGINLFCCKEKRMIVHRAKTITDLIVG